MNVVRSVLLALSFASCTSIFSSDSDKPVDAQPASLPSVDLNHCTKAQLVALPGIGQAYAKHIVDGRPYTKASDLLERKIIPDNAYEKIKDRIVVSAP